MIPDPSPQRAAPDAAPQAASTDDQILNGAVRLRQLTTGYRAAVDSVLLGAAIVATRGARALELGCGAGAAVLIAARHNPHAGFEALEREPALAALARENARANGLDVSVRTADALAPAGADRERFDHVFFNPPYLDDAGAARAPADPVRRRAFVADARDVGVEAWIAAALARVKSRGWVSLIHRADRLDAVLAACACAAGGVRVLPIHPRRNAPARRVLVAARKGVRTPMSLLAPLVLHDDDGAATPEAAAILAGEARPALFAGQAATEPKRRSR